MEGFEMYLKMLLWQIEQECLSEPIASKSHTLYKQSQAIQEAIDKGPSTSIEIMLKEIKRNQERMELRFSNLEKFISETVPMRVIDGDNEQRKQAT